MEETFPPVFEHVFPLQAVDGSIAAKSNTVKLGSSLIYSHKTVKTNVAWVALAFLLPGVNTVCPFDIEV